MPIFDYQATKTDNHNADAKLDLRRYFLRKYHSDGFAKVLDCCQGSGILWQCLRSEFEISSYWGVDKKDKKGRLKIDSVRILQQKGLQQDVIDVDTYGSPWKHWEAMLPNLSKATTVFLTIGSNSSAMGSETTQAINAMKLPKHAPRRLHQLVCHAFALPYLLAQAESFCTIVEMVESGSTGNARYIGVRLEPKESGPQSLPASHNQTPESCKEPSHV